jgi:carbon-monoxide dehydrogenase medium subunit
LRPTVGFRAAESVRQACALLADDPQARIVSGGTALSILMRQGLIRPSRLIGLDHIPSLARIAIDGSLYLGATARLSAVERDARVAAEWPVLAATLRRVATPRIRNMATIGGGVAHADPAQDPPATFVALDAQVHVAGPDGDRRIPARDFFVDYYETALRPGEIIVGVEVPRLPEGGGAAFEKFTPRSVDDYATVSACAVVRLDSNGVVEEARLVLGAAGGRPVVVEVADVLRGRRFEASAAREAAELAWSVVDPVDDVRGSADYKRDMAVVFARRALVRAAAAASQPGSSSRKSRLP